MASASQSTEQFIAQLRQQLILSQVRIMELEDTRDELTPKLSETDALLTAAQTLAENKVEEANHLTTVRADLQKQYEHLQHIQHVTNTALEETRNNLNDKQQQIEALLGEVAQLQSQITQLNTDAETRLQHVSNLEQDLATSRDESTVHVARIEQLDAEQHAMKASRSWRWTAWLRSIERRFR